MTCSLEIMYTLQSNRDSRELRTFSSLALVDDILLSLEPSGVPSPHDILSFRATIGSV